MRRILSDRRKNLRKLRKLPIIFVETRGANMIAVSNRIQVAKGQEKDFEARFEGRARLVENMRGFVRLEILRPIKSDYYIVLTHWKNEASFRARHESADLHE